MFTVLGFILPIKSTEKCSKFGAEFKISKISNGNFTDTICVRFLNGFFHPIFSLV
jgi:hypothetical protein